MITKNKTIILDLLNRGNRYTTYQVDNDRFMLDTESGNILYPELSNFNSGELMEIGKHLFCLWQENPREIQPFIEITL